MIVLQSSQNSDLCNTSDRSPLKVGINGETREHARNRDHLPSKQEQREILDLLLAPMSPNRISRHFYHVHGKQISAWKIKQVVLAQGEQIASINARMDRVASRKISIVQIDETFKGRRVSILVVIDAVTGYILHLQWLEQRNKDAILDQLRPIRALLKSVKLAMTDGAPYFPAVVKELCPNARHQICLVHVMRGLYAHLRPHKTEYLEKLREFQSATEAVRKNDAKKRNKRYSRKKLRQKLKYWKAKRKKARTERGVRRYQKDILKKFPELRKLNEKINAIGAKLRSLERTIEGAVERGIRLKQEREGAEQKKNKAWGKYMVKCRLFHRFYHLFQLTGREYQEKRKTMVSRLRQRISDGCELLKEILRILTEVRNLDGINTEGCPVRLDLNFINTNAVESINSQVRPYLECLRKITNSPYVRTYLRLVRLYLNTTRPFSGVRSGSSPIERYGYDLRGRTYLDLLLDGLPPGPQYRTNLPGIDLSRAAPNLVGKCEFQRAGRSKSFRQKNKKKK
ncbi:MAG: hypothetical protein GF383_03110 [Candidatus Lokiarchaeota archaeon]|nr:hypothetical protein [Candidatus Lokiarchaeota archaeon]MBD3338529.1 hypothetical protein [Candidatus Lokiarchaeota archaeon]